MEPVEPGRGQEHPRSRGENSGRTSFIQPVIGTSPLARGKRCGRCRAGRRCRNIPARAGKTRNLAKKSSASSEHPRSRGENEPIWELMQGQFGTSPLARGKHLVTYSVRASVGNIPARAGKTAGGWVGVVLSREHPRSRGENAVMSVEVTVEAGTSPLARGKHLLTSRVRSPVKNFISLSSTCTSGATPLGWI